MKHLFTTLAPNFNGDSTDPTNVWRWCIRCGALRCGDEFFKAGPNQESVLISSTNPPCVNLRLNMKVWTNPENDKKYLVPAAYETHGVFKVIAMSDDDTKILEISPEEFNKLPYFTFRDEGETEERPLRNWSATPL